MRPDEEAAAGEGAGVVRQERGLTPEQTQRTANPDDGTTSVRVFLRHLPWEMETVAGRSSVTKVGGTAD